jgi:hypothetical protein
MGQQVDDSVHNLDAIHAGRAPNPVLRGGDIVVVEESGSKLALKNTKDVLPFLALGAFLSDARVKRFQPWQEWTALHPDVKAVSGSAPTH